MDVMAAYDLAKVIEWVRIPYNAPFSMLDYPSGQRG